jgi:hypothetical protein
MTWRSGSGCRLRRFLRRTRYDGSRGRGRSSRFSCCSFRRSLGARFGGGSSGGCGFFSKGFAVCFSGAAPCANVRIHLALARVKYCDIMLVLTWALGVVARQGDEVKLQSAAGGQLAVGVRGVAVA